MISVTAPAHAQQPAPTINFTESMEGLSNTCAKDIDVHCAGVNVGSGRLKNCLSRNQATETPVCRDAFGKLFTQIDKHAQARLSFLKHCEGDAKKLCPNQTGDGAVIECLLSAKKVGWRCAMAVTEASFPAQGKSASLDIVNALVAPSDTLDIDVKEIHERGLERMKKPGKAQDRLPLVEGLDNRPQLDLDIQFNFDSAIVRPESYKLIGQLADALYNPKLLDRKFLIVSHIEATNKRPANLDLSQKRAAAVREILVTTFRVSPQRVVALGLGEEQLQDRSKPAATSNRRTEIIAIGRR